MVGSGVDPALESSYGVRIEGICGEGGFARVGDTRGWFLHSSRPVN